MNILEFKNVNLRRNDTTILKDINWQVEEGDNWAVLGANGSGKTSLLRCATGQFWATSGDVFLFNQQHGHCNLPELRKRIGWISSSIDRLLPQEENALNIVAAGIKDTYGIYHKYSEDEIEQAAEELKSLGCGHLLQRKFFKLSQGEKQKIRIARSLVRKPCLLILDEVCTGLDIPSRENLLELIENIPTRNLIFITHHLEEIPKRITKAITMKCGTILGKGDKTAVCSDQVLSDTYGVNLQAEIDANGRIWAKVL